MNVLMILGRLLLLPVSLIYGLLTEIRNFLFDLKILPVYHSALPVISVGNLVAGGTGKTPFTIWLAEQLSADYRVAVVSRGYRRQSKGLQIVSQKGKILLSAREAGDEPCLMARKLPRATVVVAEKRSAALAWLEREQAADVVILDDAFQHRYVHREIDIVLFKKAAQFWFNFPLPTGSWREFPWRIQRARFVGLAEKQNLPLVSRDKQFHVKAVNATLMDAQFNPLFKLSELANTPLAAFAGIARPQAFFESLKKQGLNILLTFAFSDHHSYTAAEIQKMVNQCQRKKLKYLVCTEKDLVKISNLIKENELKPGQSVKIVAVDYRLQVIESDLLLNEIKKTIDKKIK